MSARVRVGWIEAADPATDETQEAEETGEDA
jgi:hypothetical protein